MNKIKITKNNLRDVFIFLMGILFFILMTLPLYPKSAFCPLQS